MTYGEKSAKLHLSPLSVSLPVNQSCRRESNSAKGDVSIMFVRRFAFAVAVVFVIGCIASLSWGDNTYQETGKCIDCGKYCESVNTCKIGANADCFGYCRIIYGDLGSWCQEDGKTPCTNRYATVPWTRIICPCKLTDDLKTCVCDPDFKGASVEKLWARVRTCNDCS